MFYMRRQRRGTLCECIGYVVIEKKMRAFSARVRGRNGLMRVEAHKQRHGETQKQRAATRIGDNGRVESPENEKKIDLLCLRFPLLCLKMSGNLQRQSGR
jgi:hypothetical protein